MREEDLFQEALEEGDVERVREYSSKYPNITFEKGLTPIHIACLGGHTDIVKLLIEQGCDIECEDSDKSKPIHYASSEGRSEIVRILIEQYCDIECEDSNKSKPIHYACANGDTDTVRVLIEKGCNIECEDSDKRKPIHDACLEGNTAIVCLLIEKGCDIECKDSDNLRPIHVACSNGHRDTASLLIEKGCDIECEDSNKSRPIHVACSNGHTDTVLLLIEKGCNIECEDLNKRRPIHYACMEGNSDTVHLLIEKGCDIECEDSDKSRPIHCACANGYTDTVCLLFEKGCNIECEDSYQRRPIHVACANGNVDVIRLFIKKSCNIECEESNKRRPIHYACFKGQTETVHLLIEQGCDIECEELDKSRPIHIACLYGHTETVRLLIENGCSIECEDSDKVRPIHLACLEGHTDTVRLLIEKGCHTECEDSNGRTPIYFACIYGHNDIVDLLPGKKECNRDTIANQMELSCEPSCDHNGFCRESFIQRPCDMKGDLIGEGAFGAVYRLTESVTGRQFALKYIKKDTEINKLKNIENYINICSRSVEHENIVKYFGSNTENRSNDVYIFMEYVEGGSLLEYIEKTKGIPHDKVISFVKQILKGVSFLHLQRIVHRDIKPANILLDNKENVKLSDFGLSRFLQQTDKFMKDPSGPLAPILEEFWKNQIPETLDRVGDAARSMLEFGMVNNYIDDVTTQTCASGLGTPGYTAPEIRKNKSYGLAVDIWSVGTTMFHLLTGKLPGIYKNNLRINKRGFAYELMNEMCQEDPSDRPTAILLLKKIEDSGCSL